MILQRLLEALCFEGSCSSVLSEGLCSRAPTQCFQFLEHRIVLKMSGCSQKVCGTMFLHK